jgi:major membrane immunogen (membrane-anchored lipoprotein)
MVAIQRVASILVVSLLLAACGSADEPRKPPPPVEETVFRDVAVKPVEKARNVENVVMEQKDATDQAIEQNESNQ